MPVAIVGGVAEQVGRAPVCNGGSDRGSDKFDGEHKDGVRAAAQLPPAPAPGPGPLPHTWAGDLVEGVVDLVLGQVHGQQLLAEHWVSHEHELQGGRGWGWRGR